MKIEPTLYSPALSPTGAKPAPSPQHSSDSEAEVLLKKLDSMQESETERAQRRAAEARAAQEKREKLRKAAALQGRISQLRSRIMVNKNDTKAQAELSMAKTQLFWLTNPL